MRIVHREIIATIKFDSVEEFEHMTKLMAKEEVKLKMLDETAEKVSVKEKNKGHIVSEETKRKVSKVSKKRTYHHSKAWLQKHSK